MICQSSASIGGRHNRINRVRLSIDFRKGSMSYLVPRTGRSAGFSLAEVLVALAIAAVLATALSRFVSNTRLNALKIREQVAIDILSDSLIDRVPPHQWRQGRTDGYSGSLSWRIDATPIAFTARALYVVEKKKTQANSGQVGQGAAQGVKQGLAQGSPLGSMFGSTLGLTNASSDASNKQRADNVRPVATWIPYRVSTVVKAPSGRRHDVNTIRIGLRQDDKERSQTDQP